MAAYTAETSWGARMLFMILTMSGVLSIVVTAS
jgi:hypothetical protein